MATATLQYRVNNGALHTDSIAVASGDVISQTAASFAGWQSARWEIVAYPPNWSVPSGFTADVSSGYYYYLSNTGPSGVTPPDITIPDPATRWGKWTFRLTVTASSGTVVSADVSVETVSPVLGLHDLAVGEGSQFGGTRKWVGDQQDNARTLDASALVGGGFVSSLVANSPLHVNASTGAVTASWSATGDVPMSSHKITGLADPASAQDAATKAYVDSVAAGLDPKASVFVASTASITLSGTQTVDGVSVTAGKRVLAKDQGDNTTGIYLSAAGSWTRTTDLATGTSAAGVFCFVEQGTANGDKGFVCTNNVGSDVVGTDTLAWTQFSATSSGLDPNTHVWEDAATALNANGVPTRNLASSLSVSAQAGVVPFMLYPVGAQASDVEGFRVSRTVSDASGHGGTSTIVHMALGMPNAVGTDTKFAAIAAQLTSTLGPSGKMILRTLSGGTMSDWVTINSAGDIRFHGTTYASAGGRFVVDASGNITLQAITEAELRTAAAGLTTSLAVNSQKITGLADGSSSSDAAAFGQIGTAVNAAVSGTSGKVAKFTGTNVVGDSTITDDGTNVSASGSITAGTGGFIGPQIDRATLGTFAFGSNINAVTFSAALSGITTLAASDTATITKTALGTTSAAGIYLVNTTSGAGNQYTPGLRMSSYSGATQKQAAIEHRALGTSRSQIIALYGSGSTYPTSTLALFDESDSTFFDVRTRSNGFVSSQGTAGYLFTSGTGLYSSGSNDLECRSTATSAPLLLKGNKSTGGTGAAVTSRAYSGTQTAGYLHNFESGSTQMAGVAYDGTWEGPVLRNTSTKSSNYNAALYDLVEYSVGGGAFTVTLPNPAAGTQGRLIVTKNIGSSGTPLSVATGTGYIDNAATIQVAGGYASDTFVADNANGYLRIAAIRPWNFTATKTADYTTAIGEVVKCDPSGAGFNVDLPAIPSTATLRDVDVIVKNITSSTNTITIRPQAGETIDGAANVTITTARGVVRLLAIPGGTDWMII